MSFSTIWPVSALWVCEWIWHLEMTALMLTMPTSPLTQRTGSTVLQCLVTLELQVKKVPFLNMSFMYYIQYTKVVNITLIFPLNPHLVKNCEWLYAVKAWQFRPQHHCISPSGDSMRYHNGRPFSARDKNPDTPGTHCARSYMGGWWYKNCYKTNLNGLYGINSNNQVELLLSTWM